MLTKIEEINCIQDAWEPGIRDPQRPRDHFERIIKDFYKKVDFNNKNYLDLGPGHYDFGELLKLNGGITTSIELDPAVIRLGELKGLPVIEGNLSDIDVYNSLKGKFDGLFCRGSINARHFTERDDHRRYLESMLATVKSDGTFWVSPCNDPMGGAKSDELLEGCIKIQMDFFKEKGFDTIFCTTEMINQYGIWSSKPQLIYTKNLKYDLSKIQWSLKQRKIKRAMKLRIARRLPFLFK